MKYTPGSPVFQAPWTIFRNTSRASSWPTTLPVRGWIRSKRVPSSTAFMKASVTATEMLKFVTWVRSSLQVTNSRMSGWSTRRMPMFAPRREHGHPAGGPPRHPRVRDLQGRPHPGDELQHLGGGDGRLHEGRRGGDELRPHPPAQRQGDGPVGCARRVPPDRPWRLEDG